MIVFPNCGEKPVTVSQIVEKVFPPFAAPSELQPNLRDFLPDCLNKASGSFAKRLGKWLARVSTRRWGSIEILVDEDKHKGVCTYRIGDSIKRKVGPTRLDGLFDEDEPEAA